MIFSSQALCHYFSTCNIFGNTVFFTILCLSLSLSLYLSATLSLSLTESLFSSIITKAHKDKVASDARSVGQQWLIGFLLFPICRWSVVRMLTNQLVGKETDKGCTAHNHTIPLTSQPFLIVCKKKYHQIPGSTVRAQSKMSTGWMEWTGWYPCDCYDY